MTFSYADVIQMDGRCVPSCDESMSAHDDVILPYAEATLPYADLAKDIKADTYMVDGRTQFNALILSIKSSLLVSSKSSVAMVMI